MVYAVGHPKRRETRLDGTGIPPGEGNMGCRIAGQIAAREAALLGLDPGYCRRYLDTLIRYDLGPQELAGLRKYYQLAVELGLAPRGVTLEYHRSDLVESR